MSGDNITKKKYSDTRSASAGTSRPSKKPSLGNMPGSYEGQMKGNAQMDKFGAPMQELASPISGIGGLHNDIGEMSGFATDGYLDKQHMPYGEAAKFNFLPPGMDISNQENAEIHDMPMRVLVAESYPGDGWTPTPRDLEE